MIDRFITLCYKEYQDRDELSIQQKKVVQSAAEACATAYAPYSQFPVGSALLLQDGTLIHGANQENASYPCGICAERNALFHYGSLTPRIPIQKIAVVVAQGSKGGALPAAPCGLCRQVMAEFESRNEGPIEVILAQEGSVILIFESCQALLPHWFSPSQLLNVR